MSNATNRYRVRITFTSISGIVTQRVVGIGADDSSGALMIARCVATIMEKQLPGGADTEVTDLVEAADDITMEEAVIWAVTGVLPKKGGA